MNKGYYKIINGETVWFSGNILVTENSQVINPSEQILLANGWLIYEDEQVPSQPSLEDAINAKIDQIRSYDGSPDVNGFYVNGTEAWFDKETRSNFRGSLSDAEMLGETEVSVPINEHVVTLPIQTAKLFLAQIQRYADACTITTSRHIEQIRALTTIEDVEEFDITADYPQKLTFTIPV